MGSRYFGDQRAERPTVLAGGGRGLEIRNLRKDAEVGFSRVQTEVDSLQEHTAVGWEDLQGNVNEGLAVAALKVEGYRDTPVLYSFFQYNQVDTLSFKYQMKHAWKVGTQVRPHIHIIPMAAPLSPEVVRIVGYYAWTQPDAPYALPALVGWTPFVIERTLSAADQYQERILAMDLITPPSWARASSHIHVYWKNDTGHANYTYKTNKDHGTGAANIALMTFDTHIQVDDFGTTNEYPT